MGALGYLAGALVVAWAWRPTAPAPVPSVLAPVSVLKPLCGAEPELYENLRSFCDQDYPSFEIVFGSRDAADAALPVARRLAAEFPGRPIEIVVDPRRAGANEKASNLAHMMAAVRHDWVVLADSDIRVTGGYLRRVVAPLADPTVGVVTCLYRARPVGGVWSALGALFVNEWFAPSVLLAHALGSSAYVSGATIAVRRDTLERSGGFAALASHLADDHELGRRTRALGLRTVLSEVVVETLMAEPSASALVRHETRWLRTIRGVAPWGYLGMGVSHGLVASVLAAALLGGRPWAIGLIAVALALRIMLHFTARRRLGLGGAPGPGRLASGFATALLVPLRDVVGFAEWLAAFFLRRVHWRELELTLQPHGHIRNAAESRRS